MLTVVIDTEEEFDWSRPHSRKSTSVSAICEIHRVQDIFDAYGIKPTYVVDYPIAAQDESVSILGAIERSGRAEIGAHLHPWVSPPFDESVNAFNSYPGNLPPDLEAKKLAALSDAIRQSFGAAPRIYKAGRYGIGPNTAQILNELGFEIDLSIAPPFNYEADGGPDFTDISAGAHWIGAPGGLLSLPTTGGFMGPLSKWGPALQGLAQSHPLVSKLHVIGILSRLGILNHARLSPEQYAFHELKSLTRALVAAGIWALSFSFHSPTVKPACTPYVRDKADLDRFLGDCRDYFRFFRDELGGTFSTLLAVKRAIPAPLS